MAETPKAPDAGRGRRAATVSVPRAWLTAITILLVVPWLALSAWFAWRDDLSAGSDAPAEDPTPRSSTSSGPWGRLLLTPIVISPPLEYVSTDWGPPGPPVWYFPYMTADQAHAALVHAGLLDAAASRIRSTARPEPRIAGVAVQPPAEVIDGLPPDVRGRVYGQLAANRANYAQQHPFRFEGPTDAWFSGSLMSPASRQAVEPLLYADGSFTFFADLARLRDRITDEEELRRVLKTLYRQPTVVMRLPVPADGVEELAEYWGRGGRRTDLRPLLESVAGQDEQHAIDVTHLLPAFARNHLYRYPRISAADLTRPIIANCLWTALNFFSETPDDRFLDVPYALERLRTDYHIIQQGLRLGDIVVLVDAEGDLFHAAVYIAGDLVFTKNGTTPMAPWTLMSIRSLEGYYRQLAPNPRAIYHRRNGL